MRLKIVAVLDRAAQAYGRPIFVHTTGMAVRSFIDEVNRSAPDNDMHKHPEDFDLYYVGEFDDASGMFGDTVGKGPELLMRGKDARRGD